MKNKQNIVGNGSYQTRSGKVRKYVCKTCKSHFSEGRYAIAYRLHTTDDKILTTVKKLLQGRTKTRIAHEMGVKGETIERWIRKAADNIDRIDRQIRKDPDVNPLLLPDFWISIRKKGYKGWKKKYKIACRTTNTN